MRVALDGTRLGRVRISHRPHADRFAFNAFEFQPGVASRAVVFELLRLFHAREELANASPEFGGEEKRLWLNDGGVDDHSRVIALDLRNLSADSCNIPALRELLTYVQHLSVNVADNMQAPAWLHMLELRSLYAGRCQRLPGGEIMPILNRNQHMQELSLNDMPFTTLDGIGHLRHMTGLHLTNLPNLTGNLADIGELEQLTSLKLVNLPLVTGLPDLGNTRVEFLDILRVGDRLRLPVLPRTLINLEARGLNAGSAMTLISAQDLKTLSMIDCQLTSLTAVGDQLQYVNLSENRDLEFPESLLASRQLKVLELFECNVTSVPEGINQLTELNTLNVYGIVPITLPPSLLDIAGLTLDVNFDFLDDDGRRNFAAFARRQRIAKVYLYDGRDLLLWANFSAFRRSEQQVIYERIRMYHEHLNARGRATRIRHDAIAPAERRQGWRQLTYADMDRLLNATEDTDMLIGRFLESGVRISEM